MIEYALLFALGFLAATLVGLIVAPAIQRRIVAYTENRMKATTPLSPQEVRAQTDMARAAFAAENARMSQTLVREREKGTKLAVQNEALRQDIGRLASDNADLRTQIDEMNVNAGDLRSAMRHDDEKHLRLKAQLDAAEREILHKKREIEILNANRDLIQSDLNDGMISLAARETEIENLNSHVQTLRREREKLLAGLQAAQATLKETTQRLAYEEDRARQLEQELARGQDQYAGKPEALERRLAGIARSREKAKGAPTGTPTPEQNGQTAEMMPLLASPPETPLLAHANGHAPAPAGRDIDIHAIEADVRDRSAAITQRLSDAPTPEADAALREEMADVAARMIVLTDAREGVASPIRSLLDQAPPASDPRRLSLAQRAKDLLPPQE